MAAFFSGTDTATLKEEGNERNCFVSLIVNNAGTYCAAITRKVKEKKEVTTYYFGKSYEFFGDGEVSIEPPYQAPDVKQKYIDVEAIEYFMLDVEREEIANPLSYLDDRFVEIEKRKSEARASAFTYKPSSAPLWKLDETDDDFFDWLHKDKEVKKLEPKEATLFSKEEMKEMEVYPSFTPDEKEVHEAVVHMITCSLILNAEKFDLKQWIVKHMESMYKKIFDAKEIMSGFPLFSNWVDYIIDYTLNSFKLPDDAYNDPDAEVEAYTSIVAQAIHDEIFQYKGINLYIDEYLEKLQTYIYY